MSSTGLNGDVRSMAIERIDGDRLSRMIGALSRVGADPRGGITRLGLTAEEREGSNLVGAFARSQGLLTSTDAAGNLIIRRANADPAMRTLLIGSHLDTVVQGGHLDGAYGILAGLEVLRVLSSCTAPLLYEPALAAFSNEEGAHVPCPFWGSKALTGQLVVPHQLTARNGGSIRQALLDVGGDLDRLVDACWPADSIGCYLELHIEQGPVLETAAVPIGIVSAITGRTLIDLTIDGTQNHAGTTPMASRRDALTAAARVVLALEDVARNQRRCAVATVGILDVEPKSANVIPGRVRLTAEFRDPSQGRLDDTEGRVIDLLGDIAALCGVSMQHEVTMRCRPVSCDAEVIERISTATARVGVEAITMHSGAGHDAQIVAARAPAGMIFVPSRNGASHAPEEDTAAHHLVTGANVLLQAALAVCERPLDYGVRP